MPFVDELPLEGAAQASPRQTAVFAPFGTPVTPEEVRERLGRNLYDQLSEKSDDTVTKAVSRAEVYTGAVLSYLRVRFDLDAKVIREIVVMQTV